LVFFKIGVLGAIYFVLNLEEESERLLGLLTLSFVMNIGVRTR